jgi:hypothetical protein
VAMLVWLVIAWPMRVLRPAGEASVEVPSVVILKAR